jgi:hypothetical protein
MMTLLFGEYTTLNQLLEFLEAEEDEGTSRPNLTSPAYRLPHNQNSTFEALNAVSLPQSLKLLEKFCVQKVD